MSTFNGYFERQFGKRIRADRFTNQDPSTVLQLLSHAHADHTVGLSSKDLRGYVYCSAATKEIILRSATASERVHADVNGVKSENYYTFRNLQSPVYNARGKPVIKDGKKVKIDILKPLELGFRHDFSEYFGSPVTITLIDANHCPGAVMFLIESPEHAVLYTGDVRSEPFLINTLASNPFLQDYISLHDQAPRRTLDQIYLDTSAALNKGRLLSKLEGVNEALKLFDCFPPKTRFFINAWTWGYEELLRAIAHRYHCKIHLDDYKAKIYRQSAISHHDFEHSSLGHDYPELAEIGTPTFQLTRFHACERRWKCPHVRGDGLGCFESEEMQVFWEDEHQIALRQDELLKRKGLLPHTVFVNPADATEVGWAKYKDRIIAQCTAAKAGEASWPTDLLVPLARHSSLPELQDLVAMFRPHNIYPNTIYPELRGHDYVLLAQNFANSLALGGKERLARDAREYQQTVAAGAVVSRNIASLLIGAQEEEQSEEIRDEVQSKFARVSDRLPHEFIVSNFEHLHDPLDLDLLVTVEDDEDPQLGAEQDEASQELPEVMPPTRKGKQACKVQSRSERTRTPSPALRLKNREATATSPVIPSSSNDGISKSTLRRDALPASQPNTSAIAGPASALTCLAGQIICFDKDLLASASQTEELRRRVHSSGGATITYSESRVSLTTAVTASTIVLCDTRSSDVYSAARKTQKMIGNSDWLARCLRDGQLANAELNMLDQPHPTGPIEDFRNITISSTGFDEVDRETVRRMATTLGCRYLPELSKSQTTILIANGSRSQKSAYARKWKLPVVNFLWLEDCFANACKIPIDAARHQDLTVTPEGLNRRVGGTCERRKPPASESTSTPRQAAPPVTFVEAPGRPLQPATAKRKQQTHRENHYDLAGCQSKRRRQATCSNKQQNMADMPETFETVSTVHQDDIEKIRKVKDTVQRGLGLPRISSCDVMK